MKPSRKASKAHVKAQARSRRFSVEFYIDRMLEDLADSLGPYYVPLREGLRSGPDEFRRVVKSLASNAVASRFVRQSAALRQIEACVSKLPSFGGKSDDERKSSALQGFLRAEKRCLIANKRLAYYRARPMRLSKVMREVVNMAQDRIFSVLGHPPTFEIFADCGFGPGLTYGMSSEDRNLFFKVSGDQTVTPAARQLALEVIQKHYPNWGSHLSSDQRKLTVVAGNRITFVPKSADILRTIGIEPSLNVWMQKAVDSYLKRKLRWNGLRLTDQDYSSDLIVKEAGTVLGVATIDLRAASDSIAREAVRWLLPKEWYELLDVLRSHYYTLDKGVSWSKYHKFSSMGNATTFPLESLIFESLAWACCRYCGADTSRIRVYGDDIIVPPEAVAVLIEACKLFGFQVNTDKSFVFGDFRETCGVDLLCGVDIRPVYLRHIPSTPPELANLYNRLLVNRFGFNLPRTLGYVLSMCDRPLFGPAYYGWTSTESLQTRPWEEWYEGRNTLCDAYFFAPPGCLLRLRSKRYQTDKYHLERWYYTRPALKGTFTERQLYMAFLAGVEGGKPRRAKGHLKIRTETFYGDWPDLPWWPDVYGHLREPRTPTGRY